MTSFADPDFLGKHYDKLAIYFDTISLMDRQMVESFLVDELRKRNVEAYESGAISAPTRNWDSASMYASLVKAGMDGYLHITESRRRLDSTWVPVTHVTKTTRTEDQRKGSKPRSEGRQDSVAHLQEIETTTTTTEGGYWRWSIWRELRIELIDLPTGRTAWLGTQSFRGALSSQGEDFSERIAKQLGADGMVSR